MVSVLEYIYWASTMKIKHGYEVCKNSWNEVTLEYSIILLFVYEGGRYRKGENKECNKSGLLRKSSINSFNAKYLNGSPIGNIVFCGYREF